MSVWLTVLLITPVFGQGQAVEQARVYVRQAVAAYNAGDYETCLDNFREANRLRPNHPGLIYNMAAVYALADQPDSSLAWLDRYVTMGLVAAPEEDDDFQNVREKGGFADLLQRIAANRERVGHATEAFRLADSTYIPESVVYDPAPGVFYVGSVHQRRIVSVDGDGRETVFKAEGDDGLWSVLGMAVDATRRRLWVGSAAMDQTRGLPDDEKGRSGLWRYDLDTGVLHRRYLLPSDEQAHVLGDVTVNAAGDVFATDAQAGAVYVVRDGSDRLEPVLEPGTLVSPQGLCFAGQDGPLVVADYSLGLLTVDAEARRATVIPPPDAVTLLGIDGLACDGRRLIAVQNGVQPHRVVRFVLNTDATAVEQAEVLVANHPAFEEPTLGTVVGDAYYFVANSQWNKFDREGNLPEDADLRPPVILKVGL